MLTQYSTVRRAGIIQGYAEDPPLIRNATCILILLQHPSYCTFRVIAIIPEHNSSAALKH